MAPSVFSHSRRAGEPQLQTVPLAFASAPAARGRSDRVAIRVGLAPPPPNLRAGGPPSWRLWRPALQAGQSHMAVLVRNDGTAGSTLPPVGGEGRCLAQRGGGVGGRREL